MNKTSKNISKGAVSRGIEKGGTMLGKIKKMLMNTSGSILPTTALMIIPMTIAVGATVDYTRYSRMKNEIQTSSDAAVIAAARQITQINIPDNLNEEQKDEYLRSELEEYAEKFFKANIDSTYDPDSYDISLTFDQGNVSQGQEAATKLKMTTRMKYDTIFGGLNGEDGGHLLKLDVIETDIVTSVTLSNRTIEVALVVDNSGSMGSSNKIGKVITAINGNNGSVEGLLPILFDSAAISNVDDPVKVSLVPFNMMVNIGSDKADEIWMDRRGWNGHAWDAINPNTFHQGDFTLQARSRFGRIFGYRKTGGSNGWLRKKDFFDMLGVPWNGCVEQRPWPYNTTDHAITQRAGNYNRVRTQFAGRTDGYNALFSMYFAPDMPDNRTYKYMREHRGSISFVRYYDQDRYGWNDYLDDFVMPDEDYTKDADGNAIPIQFGTNTDADDHSTYNFWDDTRGNGTSRYFPRLDPDRPEFDPDRRGYDDQFMRGEWAFKYQSPVWHSSWYKSQAAAGGTSLGPNWECSSKPITALTKTKNTIRDKVAAMTAQGGTNIQQGIAWGWRSVSSSLPFNEGRLESDEENLKFMIVLTDGENSVPRMDDAGSNDSPFITSYNPMGYFYDSSDDRLDDFPHANRILGGTDADDIPEPYTRADITPALASNNSVSRTDYSRVMNVHTLQTCNNAKVDGVTVFTIAFDIPANSNAAELMRECAGAGLFPTGLEKVKADKYFYQAGTGDIDDVMKQIADVIGQIRISQ